MKRILLTLVILFLPIPVLAANTTYTGSLVVPSGGSITMTGVGAGCILADSTGKQYVAACPTGTAAFSGQSPIGITGTGPYTITCTTCFTTAGGTITGATTFSGSLTLAGATTSAAITSTQAYNGTNNGDYIFASGTSSGKTAIGANTTWGTQAIVCSAWGITNYATTTLACVDTSGNAAFLGAVTSTQFNIASKRSYKQDIQPLSLDALEVLRNICWSSYRYRPGHGDPGQTHIGFVADCAPSIVSGTKHDHFDIEAVSTVDALAILQLQNQLRLLYLSLSAAIALCLTLAVIALAKKG